MAASTNGNGSLVDEFEEAFQACLNILTKEEAVTTLEKDDVSVDVDHTVLKLIDLARQLEAFFLQKRFLLSALKPESVVKEDVVDLRAELARKDELIKRHYEKITAWQTLLADLQTQSWAKSPGSAPQTSSAAPLSGTPQPPPPPAMNIPQQPPSIVQQQFQQQQLQQQLQQQQLQHQMQQQMAPQNMMQQQAMFMQQGNPRFPVQGPGGMLQGPLGYLEKATSNIGMPDGRR